MRKLHFSFGTKIILVSCMSMIAIAALIAHFSYDKYEKSMGNKISSSIMQAFVQANELLDYNIRSYENLLHLISNNKMIQDITSTTFENQYDWYEGYRDLLTETEEIALSHFDSPRVDYYLFKEQHITTSHRYMRPHKLFPENYVDENMKTYGYTCVWSDVCKENSYSEEPCLLVSKLCVNDVNNAADAMAYIILENNKLFKAISQLDYEGSEIFVLSEDNEVLYAQNEKNIGNTYSDNAILNQILLQTNGTFVTSVDGTKSLVVFNSDNKNNWTLIGILPYEQIMQEIKSTRNSVWCITLLVTLLGFFSVYFYLRSNTKKISELSSAMEQAGNGCMDVQVHIKGRGEINRMSEVFNYMLAKIRRQMSELKDSREREHKLELRTLQQQINPHLLYNTLAMIHASAEEIDAKEICNIVTELINYYRLTLSEGMEFITVQSELSHAIAYANIMQIRFSNHLIINTEIKPEVYPYLCPKIILQPFIENAIYHGFSQNNHYAGIIIIRAWLQDEQIVFEIQDNGCGMSEEKVEQIMTGQGSHYAVKNVDTRIKLYYGQAYGVSIYSKAHEGCKITINIPTTDSNGATISDSLE